MTTTAAQHAEQAAEAVRALNHATQPWAGGLTGPGDVYDILGSLATLASRLPQALTQLQGFLDAGRIGVLDGEYAGDPVAAVAACGHWSERATVTAWTLTHALDQAHATLTWSASRVLD